jgi:glutamate carboxypeptidase
MQLRREEREALDGLADRGGAVVERAAVWCAIQSGSRNLQGLERQRAALTDAVAVLPGEVEALPLQPSQELDAEGRPVLQPHTDAIRVTVRPDAPVQVALTGHYDTVYPAETRFREVVRRDDGALNGPGLADMKGGLSVMLAALEAFETLPGCEAVGYRVLLSPDEEIGSLASAPFLAELGEGRTWDSPMNPPWATARWRPRARGRATSAWPSAGGPPTLGATSPPGATPWPPRRAWPGRWMR